MRLDPNDNVPDMRRALSEGRIAVREAVEAALGRAGDTRDLNAFALLDTDGALRRAEELDRLPAGDRGPLHGLPVTIKDLFNVEGMPTRAGTRALLPKLEPAEAPAVSRLRRAGAVILGKTNMHEIALGLTGENPWTGDVKNPHDPARMTGGSSSGSAAAVAVSAGWASLGTDTAGSIRLPPAFCGVVGFKPTYGLVPLDGALPLTPTTDHAGPIAGSVDDARAVLEVIAGRAMTVRPDALPPRFAVPAAYLEGKLAEEVRAAFEALLERVREAGAGIVEAHLEDAELAAQVQTPLGWPEAAHVHRVALKAGGEGFSDRIRAALEIGLGIKATEYLEARRLRRAVREGLKGCFAATGADAMLVPAAPVPAPLRGTAEVEIERGTVAFRDAVLPLLVPFSLTGAPALSIPFAGVGGLPLGLQVAAPPGEDARAFEAGLWLEFAGVLEWDPGRNQRKSQC